MVFWYELILMEKSGLSYIVLNMTVMLCEPRVPMWDYPDLGCCRPIIAVKQERHIMVVSLLLLYY